MISRLAVFATTAMRCAELVERVLQLLQVGHLADI